MDKNQIQEFLKERGLRPLKSLGQNFLIQDSIIQKMIQSLEKLPPPLVEIGPGPGALTSHFSHRKEEVWLIEKDKKLASYWKKQGWKVFCEDALKTKWENFPKTFTLFGNLPYEIAGPLVLKASLRSEQIPHMLLTMQKEVALRMREKPGSKNYGLLSVISQIFWDMEIVTDIDKSHFYPKPKVDGRVLKFQAKKIPKNLSPEDFLKFVKSCFAFKRKMLFKQIPTLSPQKAREELKKLHLKETCRAEELSPSKFLELYLLLTTAKIDSTS